MNQYLLVFFFFFKIHLVLFALFLKFQIISVCMVNSGTQMMQMLNRHLATEQYLHSRSHCITTGLFPIDKKLSTFSLLIIQIQTV